MTIAVTLCNGIISAYVASKTDEKEALCIQIDVSVEILDDGMIVISAWIENIGYKSLETKITNLYIDKGKANDTLKRVMFYNFPQLLKHREQGKGHDCSLAERCAEEKLAYPLEGDLGLNNGAIYEDFVCSRFPRHLSHGTVDFLWSVKNFSEDIVIKLKSGVYRVTLVCITGTGG